MRHGETEWSRSGRHTGATDVPLTARGEEEARALGKEIADFTFAEVRVSPFARARVTAELAGFDLATAIIDDDLREWDYGDYEGITSATIHKTDPGWTIFANDAPGGETAEDVARRVDRVLAHVHTIILTGGDVALVAHGHLLRVLASRWLGESARFGARLALDAGSLSVLDHEHDVPLLRTWNRST